MADLFAWFLPIALPVIATVVAVATVIRMGNVIRYIPNDSVGIVEKIWSTHGSIISGFIALHSEAGFQPDILRGGIHFFRPFMYKVHVQPLVMIGQGKVGYVYARDGQPLDPSQTLARNAEAGDFYDVRRFLTAGGQKGPQRKLLREGTHAINLAQFIVLTEDSTYAIQLSKQEIGIIDGMRTTIEDRKGFAPVIIRDTEDLVGIVTVHDGPPLPSGEIIAPETASDHDNYQDPDKFLVAGGCRGRAFNEFAVLVCLTSGISAGLSRIRHDNADKAHVDNSLLNRLDGRPKYPEKSPAFPLRVWLPSLLFEFAPLKKGPPAMSIMITNCSVPQSAAVGTVVGHLHCYSSGETVPSDFLLDSDAAGLFAIEATPSGIALITHAKMLPLGFYALHILR